MRTKLTFLLSIFMLSSTLLLAQVRFSRVKFYPPSDIQQRNELLAKLEIDHFYPEGEGVIAEISSDALRELKRAGLRFEIQVEDVAEDFKAHNKIEDFYAGEKAIAQNRVAFDGPCSTVASIIKTPTAFTAGSMGGYYTLAEMNAKMDALVAAYPNIVTKFTIGTSFEGRPINGIKISDNSAVDESGEAEVLYIGLQHAREAIGGTSLIFFMQYLAENYGNDNRVTELVNNRELFIIPCVNPDGYEYNRTTNPAGGGLWRKNRRLNSGGSLGVDLNRNWGIDWANCAGASSSCGSSVQSNDTYWGTAAFSEPETKALKTFITSRNIVLSIDQHCYGPYYSLPFGRPTLHTMSAVDQNFYNYTAALMGKYNCQRAGNSPQTVGYEVSGGMKDWMLLGDIGTGTKTKIYGLTGEAGGGSFWAPSSSIIPLSKGLCFQNLQAAYVAGSYFDIQDQSDVTVSTTSGSFKAAVRRIGAGVESMTLSLVPIENIQSVGSPVPVSTLANYNDTLSANISYALSTGITNGQRIRYAWKIETGGYSYSDTVTKFYNPVNLLFDNMEGTFSTNWTATNSPTTNNGWNYATASAYQGTKSLTESPTGNYTASSTRRVTYKNVINLADATGAYLSFWVKHRSENCNDKLRIQVSGDNGTTYTSVCGINTIMENDGTLAGQPALTGIRENWTRELVNLSSFIGKASVRFRFEFTSNTDATSDTYYKKLDDGFYIDNLQIVKTTATLATSTASLLNLSGEIVNNQDGRLSWETTTSAQNDEFIVEKSTNGKPFSAIGVVKGLPPYELVDPSLSEGNNTYRIKQVGINGTVLLSRQVNLVRKAASINMNIYPNPVTDILQIQIENSTMQNIQVQVCDIHGRILYNKALALGIGNKLISINSGNWAKQVYVLKIVNSKNEFITVQKFVKQ